MDADCTRHNVSYPGWLKETHLDNNDIERKLFFLCLEEVLWSCGITISSVVGSRFTPNVDSPSDKWNLVNRVYFK